MRTIIRSIFSICPICLPLGVSHEVTALHNCQLPNCEVCNSVIQTSTRSIGVVNLFIIISHFNNKPRRHILASHDSFLSTPYIPCINKIPPLARACSWCGGCLARSMKFASMQMKNQWCTCPRVF